MVDIGEAEGTGRGGGNGKKRPLSDIEVSQTPQRGSKRRSFLGRVTGLVGSLAGYLTPGGTAVKNDDDSPQLDQDPTREPPTPRVGDNIDGATDVQDTARTVPDEAANLALGGKSDIGVHLDPDGPVANLGIRTDSPSNARSTRTRMMGSSSVPSVSVDNGVENSSLGLQANPISPVPFRDFRGGSSTPVFARGIRPRSPKLPTGSNRSLFARNRGGLRAPVTPYSRRGRMSNSKGSLGSKEADTSEGELMDSGRFEVKGCLKFSDGELAGLFSEAFNRRGCPQEAFPHLLARIPASCQALAVELVNQDRGSEILSARSGAEGGLASPYGAWPSPKATLSSSGTHTRVESVDPLGWGRGNRNTGRCIGRRTNLLGDPGRRGDTEDMCRYTPSRRRLSEMRPGDSLGLDGGSRTPNHRWPSPSSRGSPLTPSSGADWWGRRAAGSGSTPGPGRALGGSSYRVRGQEDERPWKRSTVARVDVSDTSGLVAHRNGIGGPTFYTEPGTNHQSQSLGGEKGGLSHAEVTRRIISTLYDVSSPPTQSRSSAALQSRRAESEKVLQHSHHQPNDDDLMPVRALALPAMNTEEQPAGHRVVRLPPSNDVLRHRQEQQGRARAELELKEKEKNKAGAGDDSLVSSNSMGNDVDGDEQFLPILPKPGPARARRDMGTHDRSTGRGVGEEGGNAATEEVLPSRSEGSSDPAVSRRDGANKGQELIGNTTENKESRDVPNWKGKGKAKAAVGDSRDHLSMARAESGVHEGRAEAGGGGGGGIGLKGVTVKGSDSNQRGDSSDREWQKRTKKSRKSDEMVNTGAGAIVSRESGAAQGGKGGEGKSTGGSLVVSSQGGDGFLDWRPKDLNGVEGAWRCKACFYMNGPEQSSTCEVCTLPKDFGTPGYQRPRVWKMGELRTRRHEPTTVEGDKPQRRVHFAPEMESGPSSSGSLLGTTLSLPEPTFGGGGSASTSMGGSIAATVSTSPGVAPSLGTSLVPEPVSAPVPALSSAPSMFTFGAPPVSKGVEEKKDTSALSSKSAVASVGITTNGGAPTAPAPAATPAPAPTFSFGAVSNKGSKKKRNSGDAESANLLPSTPFAFGSTKAVSSSAPGPSSTPALSIGIPSLGTTTPASVTNVSAAAVPSQAKPSTPGFTFGGATPSPATGAPAAGFMFGKASTTAPVAAPVPSAGPVTGATAPGFSFGSAPAAATPAAAPALGDKRFFEAAAAPAPAAPGATGFGGGFSFGASTSSTGTTPTAMAKGFGQAAPSSLFAGGGGFGTQAVAGGAPSTAGASPAGFSFGQQQQASNPAQAAGFGAPTTGFGAPGGGFGATAPAVSGFNVQPPQAQSGFNPPSAGGGFAVGRAQPAPQASGRADLSKRRVVKARRPGVRR